jgi:hypothetical protein
MRAIAGLEALRHFEFASRRAEQHELVDAVRVRKGGGQREATSKRVPNERRFVDA